jgi:tellurite resistance protein TehA-like permease
MTNPPDQHLEPVPDGRVGAWLATFDPGYFAAVMATGIVSIGAGLLGFAAISDVLLVCTAIAFVLLGVAYIARAVRFPRRFRQSLVNPSTAVTYFTLVAGTDVLASALLPLRLWVVALVLGLAAFGIWLVLTYGLFCSIVLAGHHPLLRDINGIWLVWVVGTQSVSVLATALAPELPWPAGRQVLEATGMLFWGVGIVLYLVLVVIIFLRLLTIETTPAEMGPAYWILMGATAISVRAAAGILSVSASIPMPPLAEMRPFVVGFSVVLWSFGSWFIPMLVLFGLWRYFVRGYPWSYEPKLWSVVFPLGMYTVASVTLGRAIDYEFMTELASVWVWIGFGAWCLVVILMLLALVRSLSRSGARTAPAS